MRYYEPHFLGEWLAANGVHIPYVIRSAGEDVIYDERVEIGPNGETMVTHVPVQVSRPGETVFLAPVPDVIRGVLEMAASVDVYMDSPNVGDVTVEFTVPGATGSAEIRVYDDAYALVSTVTDTFDAAGVVGTVLQQPAAGVYHVVLWRNDVPPLHARVEVV